MTNILDTVPLADWEYRSQESIETLLEALLAEHRKLVLLEAVELYGKGRLDQPQYSNGYGDAYIVGWINGTAVYRDELRRMAEGE